MIENDPLDNGNVAGPTISHVGLSRNGVGYPQYTMIYNVRDDKPQESGYLPFREETTNGA